MTVRREIESQTVELRRFGGRANVLVSDSDFPDFIELSPQRNLPPSVGRSSRLIKQIGRASTYS